MPLMDYDWLFTFCPPIMFTDSLQISLNLSHWEKNGQINHTLLTQLDIRPSVCFYLQSILRKIF